MAATGVIDAFTLPAHLEAAEPPEARGLKRDGVRLLVSRIDTDSIAHSRFSELPQWLLPGDLLVVNTSGTLNAALAATTEKRRQIRGASLHAAAGEFLGDRGATPGPRRLAALSRRARGNAFWSSKAAAVSRSSRRTRSSIGLEAQSRLWIAALELAEPVLPYLERFGSPIRYGYVAGSWPESMYQTVFATEPGSAEMPSAARPFTPGARHAARLQRDSNRAPVAPHRCREPGRSRTTLRGVLSRAAGDGRTRQRGEARGPSCRRRRHDGRTRARDRHGQPGKDVRRRGLDQSRDWPGATAARGERHDHRLPRAARHASRDDRTGDRRRRRRPAVVAPRSRLPRGAAGRIPVARVR